MNDENDLIVTMSKISFQFRSVCKWDAYIVLVKWLKPNGFEAHIDQQKMGYKQRQRPSSPYVQWLSSSLVNCTRTILAAAIMLDIQSCLILTNSHLAIHVQTYEEQNVLSFSLIEMPFTLSLCSVLCLCRDKSIKIIWWDKNGQTL